MFMTWEKNNGNFRWFDSKTLKCFCTFDTLFAGEVKTIIAYNNFIRTRASKILFYINYINYINCINLLID